jgi:L-rhamnose isomerase
LNTCLKMNLENCGASRLLSMYTGKRLAQMQLANFWGIHSG